MNRIIKTAAIAAIAAIGVIGTAGAASAATTDANGVVTVSKGEIMAQFPGMNEKAFQKIAMADGQSLTGSNVFTATTTTGVGCSDGTVQHALPQHHHHQPDHAHRDLQRLGRQGHRLEPRCQGCERHHRGQHLRHLASGRFPNYATICAGSRLRDELRSRPSAQSHSDVTSFKFNGTPVSIVVNPYVAPAV